jgi:4'-phosphopantetheinyl transferase
MRQDTAGLVELVAHVWVVPLALGADGRGEDPVERKRALKRRAHQALDQLLGQYLGVEPASLEFGTEPNGKPFLAGGELSFNLSHSGELGLVAVARALPVGVDVEHVREFRDSDRLARRICSPREYEHLQASPVPDELLRLWVRKEAVVKASGEGVDRLLLEVDVLDDAVQDGWLCKDLQLPLPGYRAALAITQLPGVSIALRTFDWGPVTDS